MTYSQLLPAQTTGLTLPQQGGGDPVDTVASVTPLVTVVTTASAVANGDVTDLDDTVAATVAGTASAAEMQAYQNAAAGAGTFGMQNAASSFYAAAQSQSPYGMLQQSYPSVSDGKFTVMISEQVHNIESTLFRS